MTTSRRPRRWATVNPPRRENGSGTRRHPVERTRGWRRPDPVRRIARLPWLAGAVERYEAHGLIERRLSRFRQRRAVGTPLPKRGAQWVAGVQATEGEEDGPCPA